MKVLVINCGSSSLKYQLLDMDTEDVLASGYCEKVGIEGSFNTHKVNGEKIKIEREMPTHKEALELMIECLTTGDHKVINDVSEIDAIGHRIVHGGEKFAKSVLITDEVIKMIEECVPLAPLHNPANLIGLNVAKEIFGDSMPMVGVFDTAFHQSMPKSSYLYAIPYEYYEKYGVRRYGFHGTSHKYISELFAKMKGRNDLKIISCHIGSGASIAAIDGGKVVDTTMGLTPLEGLMMGTRSGDLDPAIIKFIADKEGKTIDEIDTILNKKSGLLGVSGVSNDSRDVMEAMATNERAKVANDMFEYRIVKYIGAYAAAMNGVDAILFTAGVGENSIATRKSIMEKISYLGIKLDEAANDCRGKDVMISTPDSKVECWVIPTNEELMIARDTKEIAEGLNK
ncbi:MAG: acetate kinase [Clostridia bacterium]|nr:acetate kinase [Clostridia bacterium]